VNTIRRDASVLKWLYEWAEGFHNVDLDAELASGHFEIIIDKLDQFSFWLRSGRNAVNIAGRIGKPSSKDWLHPRTFNDYLHTVQLYLLWVIDRYTKSTNSSNLNRHLTEIKNRINSKFDASVLGGSTEISVKGLEPEHVAMLLEITHVDAHRNPFCRNVRLRNWLIFKILLETGLRRGELLKLKTTDINEENDQFYLTIKRRPDDPTDSRSIQPAQKTLSRTVSISEHLYQGIEKYILTERRPKNAGKKITIKHQFLFTSERGSPLGLSAVNYAFSIIQKEVFSELGIEFHPHLLRNTFCNNYLEWCVEKQGMSLQQALDELRQICGWQLSSNMPLRYGAKWINKQANEHNFNRVNAAISRFHRGAAK